MADHTAWRITYWGLTTKLIAMYGLIVAVILCALLPSISSASQVTVTFYTLLAVLSVDFVGRVSCMTTPNVPRRWLNFSIVAQAIGLVSMFCAMLLTNAKGVTGLDAASDTVFHITGLVVVVLCQAVSARLFTTFLQEMAMSLGRKDLLPGLERLRNRVVATGLTANFTVVLVLVVLAVFAFLIFFCCGILAPLAAVPALVGVFVIAFPIVMVCLVLYCGVLFSYHVNLWAIRKEVGRQVLMALPMNGEM